MADFAVPTVDYTSRDYEALRDDFIKLIPFFTPEWTDFNPDDFGIVLAELLAYKGDILHFYLDRRAGEGFLDTAITRQGVINLLKLIGFVPPGASAATVSLKLTLAQTQLANVTIPKGTQVQTQASAGDVALTFETVDELIITTGNIDGTVSAAEGKTDGETLAVSDGKPFQKRVLGPKRILENSIQIFINETGAEEEWIEKSTLVNELGTAKVFSTSRDENDIVTIAFGDDAQGKIPTPSAAIRAAYRIGGGIAGNVGAGTLIQLVSQILFQGQPLQVSVTNALAASGGAEKQSLEDAKRLGPASLKTQDRAVTLDDIDTLSELVAGVGKAKSSLTAVPLQVKIVVAPAGGGVPSPALLTAVKTEIDSKKCAGTTIIVAASKEVGIDLTATVNVFSNFVNDDVEALINTALADFFDINKTTIQFGKNINQSDIFALIDNITGVDFVDISKLSLDSNSTLVTTIASGVIAFSTIVVSLTTVDETWTVAFTSPTAFTVTGSVSGLQVATGTIENVNPSIHIQCDQLTIKTLVRWDRLQSSEIGSEIVDNPLCFARIEERTDVCDVTVVDHHRNCFVDQNLGKDQLIERIYRSHRTSGLYTSHSAGCSSIVQHQQINSGIGCNNRERHRACDVIRDRNLLRAIRADIRSAVHEHRVIRRALRIGA